MSVALGDPFRTQQQLLLNEKLGYIFVADSTGLHCIFIQIIVVGSERHVCNVTERILAIQGQLFRINQCRWF